MPSSASALFSNSLRLGTQVSDIVVAAVVGIVIIDLSVY
jgi:hypothetical protein